MSQRLAYYAAPVPGKMTWSQTPEGYRIYKNANIARSGSQEYRGAELKRISGYDPRWDLKDNGIYEVFRPLEEVTSAATIASFEGKSVLDEHPGGDRVLVDALDEYEGISQGHVQNVRVGSTLPDGETPLLADLYIKNPDLNTKIEGGVRELSCGYRFVLAMDDAGCLIMTRIRGNHVAVVPRGRAGSEIAIGDALSELNESAGCADAAPPQDSTSLSFYAGRPYHEGRKLYNAYLIAHGRPPLREGQK